MLTRRRALVAGASAGIAAPAVIRSVAEAQTQVKPRVRASIASATGQRNLQILAHAWRTMTSDQSGRNGRSLAWHANAHADQMPPRVRRGMAHGRWTFFPWHRIFLLQFERAVMRITGDDTFALPFWDFQTDPFIPRACLRAPFNNVPRGPNAENVDFAAARRRYRDWRGNAYTYIGRGAPFQRVFGTARVAGFVESGGHDFLHSTVGGVMSQAESPYDVLFWLHHANIDRLWNLWQRLQARALYDTPWGQELLAELPNGLGIPTWGRNFERQGFMFCRTQTGPIALKCLQQLAYPHTAQGWGIYAYGYQERSGDEEEVYFDEDDPSDGAKRGPLTGKKTTRFKAEGFRKGGKGDHYLPITLDQGAAEIVSGGALVDGDASLEMELHGRHFHGVVFQLACRNVDTGLEVHAGSPSAFMPHGVDAEGRERVGFLVPFEVVLAQLKVQGPSTRIELKIEPVLPADFSAAPAQLDDVQAELTVERRTYRKA